MFVAVLPLLLAVVLGELAEGALDAKAVALLGILAACGAALRIPSPGVAGFEPVFFLLIPAGRVLGRGFGFVLGVADPRRVGPDHRRGRAVAALPDVRGRLGGLRRRMPAPGAGAGPSLAAGRLRRRWPASLYGTLLNLWFWPFGAGTTPASPSCPVPGCCHNLHSFVLFDLTTSLGFDIPRARHQRRPGPAARAPGAGRPAPGQPPGRLRRPGRPCTGQPERGRPGPR